MREPFRVIDWVMKLPPALAQMFAQEFNNIQAEESISFITTPKRVGHRRGLREGIEVLLQLPFGEEELKLMPESHAIHEEETLRAILKPLETAVDLDEVPRLWSSGNP